MKRYLASLAACLLVQSLAPAQAVIVQLPFQGFLFPGHYTAGPYTSGGAGTNASMSTGTSKIMFIGRVYQKDLAFRQGGTKNLQHISFSTNTSVCAACTSTVQLDVEGVSTSVGPPTQPDGVILAAGGAVSTLALSALGTGSAWKTNMPNFTTSPAVSYGQLIAVVWSFSTYDTGTLNLLGATNITDVGSHGPSMETFNGATWAINFKLPNLSLEFDDGTFGGLSGAMPFQTVTVTDTYNSGSSPNEQGMLFSLPFASHIDQLCANFTVASASSTAIVELTDASGTQLAVTPTIDGHTARAVNGSPVMSCFPINEITLAKSTSYFIGVLPTSVNNISIYSMQVGAAGNWDAAQGGGGQNFAYATRNGGAVSAPTAVKQPNFAVRVSALDDGTGSGAGGGAGALLLKGIGFFPMEDWK